jgi:hypothetical protein
LVFSLVLFLVEREQVIQGRCLSLEDLALIGEWLAAFPQWNRTRLSRELCSAWNWRNAAGRLKDMACRTLLLKLEARGQIRLPPRRTASVNGLRNQRWAQVSHDQNLIECPLEALQPLRVEPAQNAVEIALFHFLLRRYHYLGHRNGVGENLKYLARDGTGRPLACLLFGAAAWKVRARDAWIGWTAQQRQQSLFLLANQARFLILPWVRAPHLGSHLLARVTARLSADWQTKYGHPICLAETFVERERFGGVCYRAAGWRPVGLTTGRTRNDERHRCSAPVKEVFLKPLRPDWKRRLGL